MFFSLPIKTTTLGTLLLTLVLLVQAIASENESAESALPGDTSYDKSAGRSDNYVQDYINSHKDSVLQNVSFIVYNCHKSLSPDSLTFYLVGEVHLYNKETSFFAQYLLSKLNLGLLLSEGIGPGVEHNEAEKLYGQGVRSFQSKFDYDYPEWYALFKAKGLPFKFLERYDSTTGFREGTSAADQALLGQWPELMKSQGENMNRVMKAFPAFEKMFADTSAAADSTRDYGAFFSQILPDSVFDSSEVESGSMVFNKMFGQMMQRVMSDTSHSMAGAMQMFSDSSFMQTMTQVMSDTSNPFVKKMIVAQKDTNGALRALAQSYQLLPDSTSQKLFAALSQETDYMGLDARNAIMAKRSMEYITDSPLVLKLVRVGQGHLDGMMYIYKTKYSCDCDEVPLEKLLDPAH